MENKISIVIPVYNNYDLLHSLLYDLFKFCHPIHEVIIVNDCSTDKAIYDGLSWWKNSKLLPLHVYNNEQNVGFLLSSNLGVGKASGDIVILLSTDVVFKSVNLSSETLRLLRPKTIIGGILYDNDTGWNNFSGEIFQYLEGWLLSFYKSDWEELEGFDSRFAPSDFEDVDFSTKASKKGYNLCTYNNPNIKHLGGKSYGYTEERLNRTKRNRILFAEKYGLSL